MNLKPLLIAAIGACIGVAALETYYRYGGSTGGVSRTELHKIIRDYIVANPEVLQEAMAEFEKRQNVADAEKARDTIKRNASLIFNSPRQVVTGNKEGDVSLVEFFDYNCPYCKQAMADLNTLEGSDDKLRIVYKEFPVLGPGSVEAAQVAVAIRMQDPSGRKISRLSQGAARQPWPGRQGTRAGSGARRRRRHGAARNRSRQPARSRQRSRRTSSWLSNSDSTGRRAT